MSDLNNDSQPSPYAEYAAEAMGMLIDGELLRFKQGTWALDGKDVIAGTRFLLVPQELHQCWLRFENKKITSRVQGFRTGGFRLPPRNTLGDLDESKWPIGSAGPMDPWVSSDGIGLRTLHSDDVVVFQTQSQGGRRALARLMGDFEKQHKGHPGELPIVEIGVGSFTSNNVPAPILRIVAWEEHPLAPAADIIPQRDNGLDDEIPF